MSYCIDQKVSRVSQNARAKRNTPARGTRRARSVPPLPAGKERPQVPGFRKNVPDDYSVVSSSSASWGNTAFLGIVTFVNEVSFLLNAVSVLTRSLSVTIL